MGLSWASPILLAETAGELPDAPGVYRIWDPNDAPPLEYIGESISLRNRLGRHRRNRDGRFVVSYAVRPDSDKKFQLSQTESELLGAHWLACTQAPRDQY